MNRSRRLRSYGEWVAWHIGARLVPGPVSVEFTGNIRLLIRPRMTGATGVVYFGLHEPEDMGFVLHFLRPGDLFVDVGANVGTYSLLAASAGAEVIAFEPGEALPALHDNIRLNALQQRIEVHEAAVAATDGAVRFTTGRDTMNKIDESGDASVPSVRLDSVLASRTPMLIKVDVEGRESDVLRGAPRALESVMGLILENGIDTPRLTRDLRGRGLRPFKYDPFSRALQPLENGNSVGNNTLFLRDAAIAQERVSAAPPVTVRGRTF